MKKLLNYINNNKCITIYTLIETFLQIYGYLLTNDKSITNFKGIYILFYLILFILLFIINKIIFKILSIKPYTLLNNKFSKKSFFIIWILIFILWIPVFLAFYPSIFAYDAFRQIPHINNSELWSGQPIFHTLLIEFFLIMGKKISSYKLGMALYSLFQMISMSAIFSYAIIKVNINFTNKKFKTISTILLIIYYGIIPIHSILSISVAKDTLFSGLLLLFILNMYDLIENKNITTKKSIIFIINSILLLLLKNSMSNIFIILCIILVIVLKANKKKILQLYAISLISYFVIYSLTIIIFKPTKQFEMEKYSIQIQNLGYISLKHREVFNDKYYIKNKCMYEKKDAYLKHSVDNYKIMCNYCFSGKVNNKEINTAWIKYTLKYPAYTIDSWSNLNIGSWYLLDTSHTYKIYKDNLYMKYLQTHITAPTLKVKQENKIPKLKKFYNEIASGNFQYCKYKFLRFIFEPATYTLLFLLLVTYLLKNKRYKEIIPIIFPIILYISILLGPCILTRYIYPYMVIVPIIFIKIISNNKKEAE